MTDEITEEELARAREFLNDPKHEHAITEEEVMALYARQEREASARRIADAVQKRADEFEPASTRTELLALADRIRKGEL